MSNCPIDVGDEIFMRSVGSDAHIEVASIPDRQPYAETDGAYVIVDQYGEEHLVQEDGDDFVTMSPDELSEAGQAIRDARYEDATAPTP